MGNSIPDAAAFLAAAHHRSLHRKKRRGASFSRRVRIAIAALVLIGLIGAIVVVVGLLA